MSAKLIRSHEGIRIEIHTHLTVFFPVFTNNDDVLQMLLENMITRRFAKRSWILQSLLSQKRKTPLRSNVLRTLMSHPKEYVSFRNYCNLLFQFY